MNPENQKQEYLTVVRGVVRLAGKEPVEGIFVLVAGKTTHILHRIRCFPLKESQESIFPPLEKIGYDSFMRTIFQESQSDSDEPKSTFLENIHANLEYVLVHFLTPKNVSEAMEDIQNGSKTMALSLTNYLENNYDIPTTVEILFDRKEKEDVLSYEKQEETDSDETTSSEEEAPKEDTKPKIPPSNIRECRLFIAPLKGTPLSHVEKGMVLLLTLEEKTAPEGEETPKEQTPLAGTVTDISSFDDGSYLVQLMVLGDSPFLCQAFMDGNYKVQLQEEEEKPKEKDGEEDVPPPLPLGEKILLGAILVVATLALLVLGCYFSLIL